MPKNTGAGGKNFKKGQKQGEDDAADMTRAEGEFEFYAMVKQALGNLRLSLQLESGEKVIGVIRGSLVRKGFIVPGDVVLASRREFNTDGHVDILHRYKPAAVKNLAKEGVIPRDFRSAEDTQGNHNANVDVEFVASLADEAAAAARRGDGKAAAAAYDRHCVVSDDPLAGLRDADDDDDEDEDVDDL